MIEMFSADMDVHYGFIDIVSGGEPDPERESRRGQSNGLCGALVPQALHLVTGLHTGDIPLRIEWHPVEPPVGDEWEEVVEVSFEITSTTLGLSSFEEFHDLEVPQVGSHRVRYSASGMQEGSEMDTPDEDEQAPDRYLLQLWPAPPATDRIVRQTSDIAAYWHRVAQGLDK